MDNAKLKLLKELQETKSWEVFEEYVAEYIEKNLKVGNIKRATQFDTIWEEAFREGGEYHLKAILKKAFNDGLEVEKQLN